MYMQLGGTSLIPGKIDIATEITRTVVLLIKRQIAHLSEPGLVLHYQSWISINLSRILSGKLLGPQVGKVAIQIVIILLALANGPGDEASEIS